jgi:hypothetical protein
MQIMLGDATGNALNILGLADRRGEAAVLAAKAETGLGNPWLAIASYVAAPAKGGTRVVKPASSGVKPETLAVGALAAVAAYLALG